MNPQGFEGRVGPVPTPESGTAPEEKTRFQRFRLFVKVVELRLRFIALMAATGLTFAYWDTLWNHYEKWMRPTAGIRAAESGFEFFCPMHPQVVQDEHGTCPICGMPLAKRAKGAKETLPPGITARVKLTSARIHQAGIKTASVEYEPLTRSMSTVGLVTVDERRQATIVSKVPGKTRIEKLYVNFNGQEVEAGRPLAELYSPELYQAIQELLTSSKRMGAASPPTSEAARLFQEDRREMVRASSEKLGLWGITQPQIDQILKAGKADFNVPINSPISGYVIKKNVVEGQEVGEGFPMFEVADLRWIWIKAQVYEHQLGLIHEGDRIEASVEAEPGKVFGGTVEFIQPVLDPSTRTVEVRFALENPGLRLRPGMYATVSLKAQLADLPEYKERALVRNHEDHAEGSIDLTADEQEKCPVTNLKLGAMGDPVHIEVEGRKIWMCCQSCQSKLKAQPALYLARLAPPPADEVLSVPESSVIDTGIRKVVYVEAEPGVFEGREVLLGPRVGNRFPVLEGLSVGEKVATSGAFLIDAESRINPGAAPSKPSDTRSSGPLDPAGPAVKAPAHNHGARSAATHDDEVIRR